MNRKVALIIRGLAVAGVTALGLSTQVFAQDRADVLERIKPVGQVAIAGQPAPAAAPAPAAPAAEEAKMAAVETPAPVAPVPAAAPSGDAAQLYAAKGCAACHGPNGRKTTLPVYPKIAGQSADYINAQMLDIKSGARNNGQSMVMKGIMANVSDAEARVLADWLSTQ